MYLSSYSNHFFVYFKQNQCGIFEFYCFYAQIYITYKLIFTIIVSICTYPGTVTLALSSHIPLLQMHN